MSQQNKSNGLDWYSAKTVFKHSVVEDGAQKPVFEDRVVLLKAGNFEEAVTKAEKEALDYCKANESVVYLGYVDVYLLSEELIGERTEIYSLMRDSTLKDTEYLKHFHDTGTERIGRLE